MDCECRWTDYVLDSRLNDSFTAVKLLLDRLEYPYPRQNISGLHSPLWDSRNPPLAERPHNNAPRIGKSKAVKKGVWLRAYDEAYRKQCVSNRAPSVLSGKCSLYVRNYVTHPIHSFHTIWVCNDSLLLDGI